MSLAPPKPVNIAAVEAATAQLLRALGQDDKGEVMENTPRRVAEMYMQVINPPDVDFDTELKTFTNPDPEHLHVVTVNDVHYVSMCEHHLAPAFGVAHVAYIPNERVVGYSKLKKALNYVARQPQLNERILCDCMNFLDDALAPHGLAMALRSVHCCIAERTNAPAQEIVTVAAYRGLLAEDPWRAEFSASVLANRPLFLGQ